MAKTRRVTYRPKDDHGRRIRLREVEVPGRRGTLCRQGGSDYKSVQQEGVRLVHSSAGAEEAQTGGAPESLDVMIQRVDPERWLASRFIGDQASRATVVALYALNYELARVGETVTQPLTGEIRLAWWRDRLEDLVQSRPVPAQPVLAALAEPINTGALPHKLLDALVEARHADLEPTPFADQASLVAYVDGTAGALMGLAVRALDPHAPLAAVVQAGRAWGLAGLYRARAAWRQRGRDWVPKDWGTLTDAALDQRVRAEVSAALKLARAEVGALPVQVFPAVGYATLARSYAKGRSPSALEARIRLVMATATGKL